MGTRVLGSVLFLALLVAGCSVDRTGHGHQLPACGPRTGTSCVPRGDGGAPPDAMPTPSDPADPLDDDPADDPWADDTSEDAGCDAETRGEGDEDRGDGDDADDGDNGDDGDYDDGDNGGTTHGYDRKGGSSNGG